MPDKATQQGRPVQQQFHFIAVVVRFSQTRLCVWPSRYNKILLSSCHCFPFASLMASTVVVVAYVVVRKSMPRKAMVVVLFIV
jgi:hypothetical protein